MSTGLLQRYAMPLLGIGAIILITLCLTFYVLWSNASKDLTTTQKELAISILAIERTENEKQGLLEELQLRSDLTSNLTLEVGELTMRYTQEANALQARIRELEKDRAAKVTIVNNKNYLEEDYLQKVSDAVNDELWTAYCRSNPTHVACQVSVK